MAVWSTAQEKLGLWVDMEGMAIRLAQRKLEDLLQRLTSWPPE